MRKLLVPASLVIAVLFVALTSVTAPAQSNLVSYESITVGATAIGITANKVNRQCEGRLETGQVRYRFDGTNPTASEGVLLDDGDVVRIGNRDHALAIRWIRTGTTSGVIKLHCWP